MGTIELKSDLHKILDKIDNEQLLRSIYEFLKEQEQNEEGKIWRTLSDDQKHEVSKLNEEAANEGNIKRWDDIKKKY